MSDLKFAAFGLDDLSSSCIANYMSALQQGGFDTIILGLFHIQSDGTISFNGTRKEPGTCFKDGSYVGPSEWPSQLRFLQAYRSNVKEIVASFGGGSPVADFSMINQIYNDNHHSFEGTPLKANFEAFAKTFKNLIPTIDLDNEDCYDPTSFVAFCKMLIDLGFDISFCMYMMPDFWAGSLAELEAYRPGKVIRWNVMRYGLNPPDVNYWVQFIQQYIRNFNADKFIFQGVSARDGGHLSGLTPNLKPLRNNPYVGGSFLWNLDEVINGGGDLKAFSEKMKEELTGES